MVGKGKSRRRLALMVALALSTGGAYLPSGGGFLWQGSTAYAADVTVGVSEDQAGDVTGGTTDNNTVTIGAESGGLHPVIGGNVVGGTSANATGNTVTINSISATAAGNGTVFGGLATGTASNNTVNFKGGKAISLIGGATTGASGNATGNTVTVSGGDISYVWGGLARTAGAGSATGNTVTVNGGTFAAGGVIVGGGGMNNTVTGNMSNNIVTIAGGTMNSANTSTRYYIMGGDSRTTSSTSNGNTVNLGAADGTFTGNITRAEVWGTGYNRQAQANGSDKLKGNTLNVNASNIHVRFVRNFEKYNFNLTKGVAAGSAMLTTHDGGFGTNADVKWDNITLNAAGWNDDHTKYGRIGNVTLLQGSTGSDLNIAVDGSAAPTRSATSGDFEYRMSTDVTGMVFFNRVLANYVQANVDRFRNADATYNGTTAMTFNPAGGAAVQGIVGGYSNLGNTTTNNKLLVKSLPGSHLAIAAGGYTAGTSGNATNNHVTVDITGSFGVQNVYGSTILNTSNAGTVSGSTAMLTNGMVQDIYGGYTLGTGAVTGNTATIGNGQAVGSLYGGYIENSTSTAEASGNHAILNGGKVSNLRGGGTAGSGDATNNAVLISGGEVAYVQGGMASGGAATNNTVTIAGGKVTSFVAAGWANGNQSNNTVNLGDGTTATLKTGTDLSTASIYGAKSGGGSRADNTLNIKASGITVKEVDAFDTYNFVLNDKIAAGSTMLHLVQGGLGTGALDWSKVKADETGLGAWMAAQTARSIELTLVEGATANSLSFTGGSGVYSTAGNYEIGITTNTGTNTAQKLLLGANQFKNVTEAQATYDGTTPPTLVGSDKEVCGGLSKYGNTTENNQLKITGVAAGDSIKAYGGKTEQHPIIATGGSKNNSVTVEDTGTGTITMLYGGYTRARGAADGAVTGNTVTVKKGTVNNVFGGENVWAANSNDVTDNTVTIDGGALISVTGGSASGAGTVSGNTVTFNGGTVNTLKGGQSSNASGKVNANTVTITGGTVTGEVYGGYTTGAGKTTNNTVNLGDGTAATLAAGTNLSAATLAGGNDAGDVTGNTLNVKARNVAVDKVKNFETYKFFLHANTPQEATMLTIAQDGFGGSTARIDQDIALDGLAEWSEANKNRIFSRVELIKSGVAGALKLSDRDAYIGAADGLERSVTVDDEATENGGTVEATSVYLRMNRFKDGRQNYNGAEAPVMADGESEVYGGVSYHGNKTENNELTVTGTPGGGELYAVYGGKTAGAAGGSENNTVNVELESGKIKNVYGGFIGDEANAADVVGNKVNLKKGEVGIPFNAALYGGYTEGTGTAKDNIVTITGGEAKGFVTGGWAKVAGNATGNRVVLENGKVRQIFSGWAAKKAADNTVLVKNATVTVGVRGAYGKEDTSNNVVTVENSTVRDSVIAAYLESGDVATGNKVRIDGGQVNKDVWGAYGKSGATVTENEVTIKDAAIGDTVFGGHSINAGKASGNTVTIEGSASVGGPVYAGYIQGNGEASNNKLRIKGGTFAKNVYGGYSLSNGKVENNEVTITGGAFSKDVYGGFSGAPSGRTTGSIVNLGDGTTERLAEGTNLENTTIYGGSGTVITGNTLNVKAKDIKVKTAKNFSKYVFHLTDDIARNGTGSGAMLTFKGTDGFGETVNWNRLDIDTSKLSGDTVIGKATLLRSDAANALRFSAYTGRDKTTAVTNGDYETALRTDTNTGTASEVLLDYNRFQNNTDATYDGSTAAYTMPHDDGTSTSEIYGGISYVGNTTKSNHLTITNLSADIDAVYGGKNAGAAGDSTGNSVTVEGTGTHALKNVYGGYINNAASAGATGNTVTVTGGTIAGDIYAGYTAGGGLTTGNTVNLGDGTNAVAAGTRVAGTIYGGSKDLATDNTLNVKGTMTAGNIKNFENVVFHLNNTMQSDDTLLTLNDGSATTRLDWAKVKLGSVITPESKSYEAYRLTLLHNEAGLDFTKLGVGAADTLGVRGETNGNFELAIDTDTHLARAKSILLEGYQFQNNETAEYTAADATHVAAWGGRSAIGNTVTNNTLTMTGGELTTAAYGGLNSAASGAVTKNRLILQGGKTAAAYGGYGAAAVTGNTVTLAGAEVTGDLYGGYSTGGNAADNTVTITGGKAAGNIYAGYTTGAGKTMGNTVNLGDGTAATLATGTDLSAATLYGGSNAGDVTGNTLNVKAKDAAAKKAQNFENYTFHLTDHIAADKPKSGVVDDAFTKSRGTMLTLAEGFDGQTADWSKVTVDTSKLSADKTLGAITLMKSTAANKLKFSNYAAKNHAVSGDYEVVQRTDTNTSEANAVLIDVNRFRNGDVTYHNGDNNAKTYAGVSYGGNTAEGNAFTLKGISEGKTLQYVSGGRSEGTAGGAVKNTVNLLGTGKGTLEEVYGGYVGNAANAADVTENTVNIAGGTAKNVYGGYTRGTGKTVKNIVNIGYTDEAGVFHDVADGAKITGTIYGGSGSDATGNVLNVSGKIAAGNIKNFESVKFHVRNTMASGTTLLTLDGAAATEGLDWANVTLDEFKPAVKSYEAYRLTLMANEKGIDFRKGGVDTYAPIGAKGVTKGDYEAALDTDTHAAQAKAVNAEIYRFHGNTATYGEADGAHDAAWGGRSVLGNDATDNTLTISGGTLKDAYGGWSTGKKADGTSGKTTGNTVNFTGGTVTGTIYGGNNGAAGNTLNVTGIQSAGDIKNFEKLHFDTSMAKAGDTILTLNGGKKTTGLDWQKVEAAGLDEASLATRTGVAREELFSLMANDKGIDFGTSYDKAKEKTVGDYEYAIAKEADAAKGAAAEKVVVRGFRFQNNADSVYETGDNKAAWGGRSIIGNTVQRNKLTVKGGTLTEAAYGGLSAKGAVTDNTLVLAGGTLKNAYGGFVEGAGDATKNTVEVQKDTQAQIYGGYAAQGEASGNILNLGAVNIGANVYGGSGKKTDGNVINLFGTKIKGTVTGGTAADGKANVLAIRAADTEIGDFKGIQNLKFYLPEGAKSSMATMLRLGVKDKDIKGLNVDLNLSGAAKTLKREDVFSLMKVAEGGTLTTDEKIKGEVTGTQGVSLDYKFRVQKKGTDELIAAVESVKMKDATKSLAETRTTATDVLGGGMTMLADAGVSAAVQAAASANANAQVEAAPMATNKAPSAKAASAANVQSGAYTAWAAQGGSSMRIHSGSYVDTHGYTLNVGFARKQDGKDSTLTFGPFVEYGRASYDSYLEDAAGTHGSGKVSYIGAGVLARQDLKSGLYLEGSVRGGRIKSDYEGNISGTSTSYDISNPYYAIHLGVGKETKLKAGDALETYLKYFFSHQNGTSGKLSTGEDYDFDAVNSHRLRLGARYTHDMGEEGKFYAGLAWEYEFNGEARATYQGMATSSPSLKGGSAMLELGYRFTPKKSRVSYDVNFSGWQGKREGFSGSVGVNWAF